MTSPDFDQLTVDRQQYIFRDGNWTTPAGLFVSTSHGQVLTMAFYARFGRAPLMPVAAPASAAAPRRHRSKSATAKPKAAKAITRELLARRRAGDARREQALATR